MSKQTASLETESSVQQLVRLIDNRSEPFSVQQLVALKTES